MTQYPLPEYVPNELNMKKIISRKKLVDTVLNEINELIKCNTKNISYYVRGSYASGKTSLLHALGKKLVKQKKNVVYVAHMNQLKDISETQLLAWEQEVSANNHLYLLVDDMHTTSSFEANVLHYIFKNPTCKTILIGAGITPFSYCNSMQCKVNKPSSFLSLSVDELIHNKGHEKESDNEDEKDNDMLSYFATNSKLKKSKVKQMFLQLLAFTSGHVYQFVALAQYFLLTTTTALVSSSQDHGVDHNNSNGDDDVLRIIFDKPFYNSQIYQHLLLRSFSFPCFGDLIHDKDNLLTSIAFQLFRQGRISRQDKQLLKDCCVWNEQSDFFVSPMFLNYLQSFVHPIASSLVVSDKEPIAELLSHAISRLKFNPINDEMSNSNTSFQQHNALLLSLGYYLRSSANAFNGYFMFKQHQQQHFIDLTVFVTLPSNKASVKGKSCSITLTKDANFAVLNESFPLLATQSAEFNVLCNLCVNNTSMHSIPSKFFDLSDKYYSIVKAESAIYKGDVKVSTFQDLSCNIVAEIVETDKAITKTVKRREPKAKESVEGAETVITTAKTTKQKLQQVLWK